MPTAPSLLIFGLGYCGTAVADAARGAGFVVTATARQAAEPATVPFDAAAPCIAAATHLLSTVPPDGQADTPGDPVLAGYAAAIAAAPRLCWIGYLSSTVVYGDRAGGWVDEDTPPAPSQDRGLRRLAAETAWGALAGTRAVDIFRLAGIYGPGRSAFDALRSGHVRRIVKPGHDFGRIHRDDIAAAVLAAMRQDPPPGRRMFNLADDTPAETATVIEEAARLLGMPPPPAIAFADAAPAMSPMARSFWAENRKVASRKTQSLLGLTWRYPSYREGLRAILREEAAHRPA
ncbi:MAG: SDR family NAD(P)-dependent oxidoreductase [Acetobacteraceae bacterium]|jgi:nucleoside-diphosphate-sugar epimerase